MSIDPDRLPDESAIAAITLAVPAAGHMPRATQTKPRGVRIGCNGQPARGRRSHFDADAARADGRAFAVVRSAGRSQRTTLGGLFVAATALSHGLTVSTRSADDFAALDGLVSVVEL